MPMLTYPTDPLLPQSLAQKMFDVPDEDDLIVLVTALTSQFLAMTNRVRINSASVTETIRLPLSTPCLYLHAHLDTSAAITVKEYTRGALARTYEKTTDFVAEANEWSARLDMLASSFAAAGTGAYTTVEYTGGWSSLPGGVLAGAEVQGRVMLKRLKGDAGSRMRSHRQEKKAETDNRGIVREAADLWRPYVVMV